MQAVRAPPSGSGVEPTVLAESSAAAQKHKLQKFVCFGSILPVRPAAVCGCHGAPSLDACSPPAGY